MLLTLCLRSICSLLKAEVRPLALADAPAFVRESLGLHGLTLSTELLRGANRSDLEAFRDRADKVACSCLLLEELDPLAFASDDPKLAESAVDRAHRVLRAAQILGCNSAAVRVAAPSGDSAAERAVERLRRAVDIAERFEVNLLIAPHDGLTEQADRVTDLLKRIGGFRIGTLPDFAAAADSPDPPTYLRRLTPYASVVIASTRRFDSLDDLASEPAPDDADDPADLRVPCHVAYDLQPMVEAVISVGFDITLALNYLGEGDPVMAALAGRAALEHAIDMAGQKD